MCRRTAAWCFSATVRGTWKGVMLITGVNGSREAVCATEWVHPYSMWYALICSLQQLKSWFDSQMHKNMFSCRSEMRKDAPRTFHVIHVSWQTITGNYNRDLNAVRLDACLFITDIRNFVRVDVLSVAAMRLCDSLNNFSHFHNLTSVSCVFYFLSASQIGK